MSQSHWHVCRYAYKYAILLNNMHQLNSSSMPSFASLSFSVLLLFLFSIQQPLSFTLSYATGSQSMPPCHRRGQRKVIYLRAHKSTQTNKYTNCTRCLIANHQWVATKCRQWVASTSAPGPSVNCWAQR